MPKQKAELIAGGLFNDERGRISFVNSFAFLDIKRFYIVQNKGINFLRGWNFHRTESKFFYALIGVFKIGIVEAGSDGQLPDRNHKPQFFILEASRPSILAIPPMHANMVINLTEGAQLLIFSDMNVENSIEEKIRIPKDHWVI